MHNRFVLFVLLWVAVPAMAAEPNWHQFRGPGSLGVSENPGLPDRWTERENVRWTTPVPGRGWSSPIVWGSHVLVTTVVNDGETEQFQRGLYFGGDRPQAPDSLHHWLIYCLDLDSGEVLWREEVHQGKPDVSLHIKNSYASETPVTDGERVYAYFGNVGVFCYTLDGKPQWNRRFEPRKTRNDWGTAASPVLYQDRLYVVNDNEQQSSLTALDKRTGEVVWQIERDEKSNWATPFVWKNRLRTEIITPGTGYFRSYDLDGNLLYQFGGGSSITIATPYAVDDLLYVSSGYILDRRKPVFAIRPGAEGEISLEPDEDSNDFIAWCQRQAAPYNPTTLTYQGLLYVLLDRGFLACYDAKTGEQVYSPQRLPDGRAFTASPWAYDGKVFCLSEYGVTFVVQAGREFKLLHTNSLEQDAMCMASPAIAGDKLIIRTNKALYCLQGQNITP